MVSLPSKAVWTKKQQCPCGDRKCFIPDEGEADETNIGSQSIKNDPQEIEPIITPYLGMVFKSDDYAFDYYGDFARKNGFSIRKERSRLSPQLGVYKRDFVCYRAGFAPVRKKLLGENQRDRKSIRCGCDAKMYLSKEVVDVASQWRVVQFSNVHNHELLEDDQVRLLPAYRKIHEADQERILLLSKAGFPINRIVKVLELEKGIQGTQLSFLERDVRNFIQNRKKVVQESDALLSEKRENDMVDLLEACRISKEANQFFVYDVSVDENDRVENVAWSFGDSVEAYNMFGDVIYFESSYCSMTYGMCFVAFLGIDNHGKLLFFGCSLSQDETARSFSWAVKAFLRFMKGRSPQTIITDINHCIRVAVKNELPNTKHVISPHHIKSRISSWFSFPLGTRFPEFKYEFEEVCNLECSDEFEFQWNQMVSHFRLNADKHISLLFPLRVFWALPYTRGCFNARMKSVSYLKSVDKFTKQVLKSQDNLCGLLEQVGLLSNSGTPSHESQYMHMKTCLPMEEHARGILTPFAFNYLQKEMVMAMQYAVSEMANGSYLVRHYNILDGERLVIWMPEGEQIHCSCKEFEMTGIICRHALRVLLSKNYFQIPRKYLLNRWCQERTLFTHAEQICPVFKDAWYHEFESLTGTLFSEAAKSKERSDFVQKELTREMNRLISQVRGMPAGNEVVMESANAN